MFPLNQALQPLLSFIQPELGLLERITELFSICPHFHHHGQGVCQQMEEGASPN